MKRITGLLFLLAIGLIVVACGPAEEVDNAAPAVEEVEETNVEAEEEMAEEEMMSNTIVDIAVNDGRFTTLVTAVTEAGLVETLSGEGPFTVFAPTDDAFAALPEGTVEGLLEDPEGALTNVLLYHVVSGAVNAETVVGLDSAATVGGEEVAIAVEDGSVFLNESVQVIITDIEADNGIIHVIDAVLLPPSMVAEEMDEEMAEEEMMSNTIVDIAVNDGRFTTLVTAVTEAGLVETLSGEGPFTVFAPTDDAFAALPEGTVEGLLEDPEGALTNVLLYHVVSGAVNAETVIGLDSAATVGGEEVAIAVEDGSVFLNESVQVIITDIEADNGIIHVIDAVLLPPSMVAEEMDEEMMSNTIVDIAVNDGRFTTLVTAVTEAGLVETLSGEGPFTVFAPTDDAFAALPEGTVEGLLEDPEGALTNVLLYHVVSGAVNAETVVGLDSAATVGGEEVAIAVEDGSVFLNETVQVIITDIEADNGIIHVIDAVLLPPSMTAEQMDEELSSIAEVATEAGIFTTLLTALDAAGLAETFAGEGSFTVFAPTDDAFAALPEGTLESLLEDPAGLLTDILLYHVVDGNVPAADVVTLEAASTLLGQDVTITIADDGSVFLNDTVQVITTDIKANNGVIHVIDAVLLPSS